MGPARLAEGAGRRHIHTHTHTAPHEAADAWLGRKAGLV